MVTKMSDGEILCKKQKLATSDDLKASEKIENSVKQMNQYKLPIQKNLQSKIFKLNIDCLDEIFEYLSLKDLHSFGKTCKRMHKASGEYYKRNYSAAEKMIGNDGIYTTHSNDNGVLNQRTQISAFNEFTQFLSHYYEDFEPFRYIKMHSDEFRSLNHLYLVCIGLHSAKLEYFQAILPQIEILQIRQCTIWDGDFYEILLKFCNKLKRLYVQDDLGDIICRRGNRWLLQIYASLEHLELTPRYSFEIIELKRFFEINSNLRSFSISSHSLWINRNQLLQTNKKLDLLEVKHFDSGFYFYHVERIRIQAICDILKELREYDFYSKLYLHVRDIDENSCEKIAGIQGLERFSIKFINRNAHFLASIKTLKELCICECTTADLEQIANGLIRLEKVYLQNATYDDMMTFIRRSPRLTTIKITPNEHFTGALNLELLNDERKRLNNARKLIIYIEDNIFLATKWKNGDTNRDRIEIRRSKSFRWSDDFFSFRPAN